MPLTASTFLGGVPSGTATSDVLTIGVLDAMNRALEHNLGVLVAEQQLGRSDGTRWKALSELLPNINGRISETRQVINLESFGFGTATGSAFAGIPSLVGPFNVFDARIYVSQSVVDLAAIASARGVAQRPAARYTYTGARIRSSSCRRLFAGARRTARAEACGRSRHGAGVLTTRRWTPNKRLTAGSRVARPKSSFTPSASATSAANDAEKMAAAQRHRLPLGQKFALDPNLPELPSPDMSIEQAIERAYSTRADYRRRQRVMAAEATRRRRRGAARVQAEC